MSPALRFAPKALPHFVWSCFLAATVAAAEPAEPATGGKGGRYPPHDFLDQIIHPRNEVKSIEPSKVSLMPPLLLSRLNQDEVPDLVAYVLSGGDPANAMFRK